MKRVLLTEIIVVIIIFSFSACSSLFSTDNKKNTQKVNVVGNITSHPKEKKQIPPRNILKAGDKGNDVKDIQKKLKKFGYTVDEDGDFGEQTVYAVMDFQHKHGLTTDGIVKDATLADLKKKPTEDMMYKPTAEVVSNFNSAYPEGIINKLDTQSYTDYYIMVSTSEQMVYIFNGRPHEWKLINLFQCASGTGGTPTVKGQFFVGIKGAQFKSESGAILKYFTQFKGNYLFHSVLFDENGNLIDGTLGRSASHGCIRLALENAKYIYDNVPIGSGILIR
ncbi:MAG: L,D-transpeptidase family protein [Clostridium sp.]|jgi:peptidoglycan hydrolase-like protein with peptidoglycan-binding domain|uniref:L,D-transpeptidase family protein n=1 Tax=Clostridium sp. TaxID=1506 RepID=UPI0025BA39BE|nr:L,D-transpeptidase family protein [Clostridium sp.]MCH3965163.1 L,D-transpeptidase family protein [Clostridium sp.]MCI1714384.1 L,D-transpeptidase family protein [Clostridium sp.]MCI1798646.1 L,D-transpeptidase family protein [Clostridium sp.]MCI1812623.1 L,D-transpeptidase family protein [Clostridium sp.]MCI1869455.1 L,D-transpeptidase family protein [Clostridium sp.]